MTFNMFCSTISVPKDIIRHTNNPYLFNILLHFLLDFYNIT